MTTPQQRLAVNLRVYRAIHKLSQRKMAHKLREAGLPWSATTVSIVENGQRRVSVDELFALASALDTTVDRLFEAH